MLTRFLSLAATILFAMSATAALAKGPQADHVQSWHNTGSGHQANNAPGDRADDRHGFTNATAGNSGKSPAVGHRCCSADPISQPGHPLSGN